MLNHALLLIWISEYVCLKTWWCILIWIIARENWWCRVAEVGKKFLLMAKFPLQFLWLHYSSCWFVFNCLQRDLWKPRKLLIVGYARYYTISLCACELLHRQLYTCRYLWFATLISYLWMYLVAEGFVLISQSFATLQLEQFGVYVYARVPIA